jgi:hypothetical protein
MTIDFYRWDNIATNTLLYPKLLHSPPRHSHSMVLSDDNTLIYQLKFFPATARTDSPTRQKFCALDFKKGISTISVLFGFSDYRRRSVDFSISAPAHRLHASLRNTVNRRNAKRLRSSFSVSAARSVCRIGWKKTVNRDER